MYACVNKNTKVISAVASTPIEITPEGIYFPFRATDILPSTHDSVEIPDLPGPFVAGAFTYDNGQVTIVNDSVYELIVEPSVDDLVNERNRRLSSGFDYDFGDARGVHRFGTTEADMNGWDEVTKLSTAAQQLGLGNTPINIKTDTGMTQVTASEWPQVLVAAGLFRQPIYQGYFILKAMSPIPYNYKNDAYWTGV